MMNQAQLLQRIYAEIQRAARAAIAGFTTGGKLDLATTNRVGRVPVAAGGTGNDRGAGPHALVGDLHTASGLTTGDVLTATGPSGFAFQPPTSQAGSAWSVLTNGDPADPQLVWDSFGDVIMTEVSR